MAKPTMRKPECPDDGVGLWFEILSGIRVFRKEGRNKIYSAKCANCHKVYEIRTRAGGNV